MANATRDEQMAPFDIYAWYRVHKDLCPNCGWVLKDMHPMQNLYPHWTGACKELREKEYEQDLAEPAPGYVALNWKHKLRQKLGLR